MSETPRTDAEALWPACDDSPDKPSEGGGYVYSDFARQLEGELTQAQAELCTLRAECERLKEDAERYRWLRAQMHITGAAIVDVVLPNGDWSDAISARTAEELDSAIDAARKDQP